MGFQKRFGGWRPVQLEEGTGSLRLPSGAQFDAVTYRFEVWHQMVDGFPGPFRSEGSVRVPENATLGSAISQSAVLTLEDGRFLTLRLTGDGGLLAHEEPSLVEPVGPPSSTRRK